MAAIHAQWGRELARHGKRIGREGMSKAVIEAVEQFDGSYKGAMVLAGRLKAVSQMASCDDYWSEKVSIGFHAELDKAIRAREAAAKAVPA